MTALGAWGEDYRRGDVSEAEVVAEAADAAGEQFGESRIEELITEGRELDAGRLRFLVRRRNLRVLGLEYRLPRLIAQHHCGVRALRDHREIRVDGVHGPAKSQPSSRSAE